MYGGTDPPDPSRRTAVDKSGASALTGVTTVVASPFGPLLPVYLCERRLSFHPANNSPKHFRLQHMNRIDIHIHPHLLRTQHAAPPQTPNQPLQRSSALREQNNLH